MNRLPLKRHRLPKPVKELLSNPRVASFSYDPSTGAVAVTLRNPPVQQPDLVQDEPEQEPGEQPEDWRFALERFNESPKARRQ